MKGVYIFMADGFEDVEALATRDVLLRGGVDVRLVSISDDPIVNSAHGLMVGTDGLIEYLDWDHEDTTAQDFMIFPGGLPGSSNLAACKPLISEMNAHYAHGGSVAAICAAPGLVLSQLEETEGLEFTCYDSFEDMLIQRGAKFNPQPAVKSGRVITGRSAGHAISFALEILKAIKGEETAEKVKKSMYL